MLDNFLKLHNYYQYDLKANGANNAAANKILANYSGSKNEYFYYLKSQENMLNATYSYYRGLPKEALDLYLNALNFAELAKNSEMKAIVLKYIGAFYIEQHEYVSALKYLRRSQKIGEAEKLTTDDLYPKLYGELSEAYIKLNELDSALKYINLIPPEKYSTSILFTIANFHEKKETPEKAIIFLDAIIAKTKKGGLQHWLPFAKMRKGDNLYKLNKFKEAETHWLAANSQFKALDDNRNLLEISERLYNYYTEQGASKKAAGFSKVMTTLNDSLQYNNYSAALKGIEDKHLLKLKNLENATLKENEIINQTIIQRQRMIGLLGLLCMGGLIVFGLIYFRTSTTKKQLSSQLEEANSNLKQKDREIKAIVDKLSLTTGHFPEGVARLNEDFLITYANDNFKSYFNAKPEYLDTTNIFEMLGFSSAESKSFEQDLCKHQTISFNWTCSYSQKRYQ